MILLYAQGGSREFEVCSESAIAHDWEIMREAACEFLDNSSQRNVAEILRRLPFYPYNARNPFGDEFQLILAKVGAAEYAQLSSRMSDDAWRTDFTSAGKALQTVGFPVRLIAVELKVQPDVSVVNRPKPIVTSSTVERALHDAELLLRSAGATSAVDRAHTALHGYLKELCDRSQLAYTKDPGVAELFKLLREKHPAFSEPITHDEEVTRILRALATVLDSANTLRNRASVAHANAALLEEAEAMLVINAARTFLHYIDAKAASPGAGA